MHFEALQELALHLSGERSVDAVLRLIVDGLAQQSDVALDRAKREDGNNAKFLDERIKLLLHIRT